MKIGRLLKFLGLLTLIAIMVLTYRFGDLDVQDAKFLLTSYRMKGPLSYNDKDLLDHIRRIVVPPSVEPYNLHITNGKSDPYNAYRDFTMFLDVKIPHNYFKDVNNGFFVEAGALDGEFLSNTLDLERLQGWTGLLVEPDYSMYQRILAKHRKAWVSHSCLATKPYPHEAILRSQSDTIDSGNAQYKNDGWNLVVRGHSTLERSSNKNNAEMMSQESSIVYESVQCFPIASLLLALNVTKVDFFSLDVEDVEEDIIDNFPFDLITVDVWYIEHRRPNMPSNHPDAMKFDPDFVEKFTSRGYVSHHFKDYIFVRKGSRYSLDRPDDTKILHQS